MTLIIALRCTDGVIMASDSQSTEEAGNIGYPVPKIFELIPRAVWGGSGSGQIIRELRQQFDSVRDQLEASPAIAQSLVSVVKPVLQAHYNNFIPNVPGLAPGSPATGVLAAGYSKDSGAWIVEVDPRCQYTHYDELGFHAIGSAAGFAQLAMPSWPISNQRTVRSVTECSLHTVLWTRLSKLLALGLDRPSRCGLWTRRELGS